MHCSKTVFAVEGLINYSSENLSNFSRPIQAPNDAPVIESGDSGIFPCLFIYIYIYTGGRRNNANTVQYSYKLLHVGCTEFVSLILVYY